MDVAIKAPAKLMTCEQWKKIMDVNLDSAF